AIEKYLADKTPISDGLRKMVREIPEFGVAAATTTRSLAQHVLWTGGGTLKCNLHLINRGLKNLRDGYADIRTGNRIHGIPAGQGKEDIRTGTVDCGCTLESALWDLFFSKTMKVRSDNPNVVPNSEYLGTNLFTPRHRAFFIQAYSSGTGLTLDDLYSGQNVEFASDEYWYRVHSTMLKQQVERVNEYG
ncbi:hypothetical protein B0H17DRAFT_865678, partial [Mycena rosella]